ncbi:liprin-beta-1-like isoform X1 [Sinocyclocheilus anshuiensis]|uniref:liprin-beta-1-like isoform X1 n=1 Tax=Sinocyclocheilus anshuiensis TaxID=1608454 RepID=UPI0007B946B0|nr:PREDICTED: liprin-beta-1-like isoform X1 [Sinocyclocheilus anshuiensis]XP_016320803.1 PREDICTED: liprin-beta-1-like isoform X1 [Sinocyclocheilus anshuiensis]XP_016320804.1 PREDICTED: liprin-beta-1-like isoform X1 [Sinocyclocheilus anshuiensis]
MMSDASDMLAAALEQMDGIIAGSKALDYSNGIFDCQSPTSPFMGSLRALNLLEDLRGILELMDTEERESLRCQIPDSTADSLVEWLHGHLSNGHISITGDVYQDRLNRLESDKESLVLQVSVLTDQVEAQGEKIRDLDLCLDEHHEKLNATEEMLQQELLCRSALETQKLELMAEVSNSKLKLTAMEKERLDFDDRFGDSEGLILEIDELRYRISELENERLQYEKKLKSTKEELVTLRRQLDGRDGDLRRLQDETGSRSPTPAGLDSTERVFHTEETLKKRLKEKHMEVQKMKKAMESLMAANEEKDCKIEELRQSLMRYKKVQEMVMSAQGRKDKFKDGDSDGSNSDSSLSMSTALSVSMDTEKSLLSYTEEVAVRGQNEATTFVSTLQVPSLTVHITSPDKADNHSGLEHMQSSSEKGCQEPTQSLETPLDESPETSEVTKSANQGNLDGRASEKSKEFDEFNKITTLPPRSPSSSRTAEDDSFGTRKMRSSFGRGFFKIKGGKRTASAPNLAETERDGTDHLDLAGMPQRSADSDSTHTLPISPEGKKKSKGIKALFGKLKRSQSTTFNLDDNLSESEFKRGGVRATAGPRLGWSRDLQNTNSELDAPFARWSREQVCDWMQEQGLGLYVSWARQWVASGQTLLQASQQDLERELGIKHPLHRKKLQLALQALGSEEDDNKGKLDYHWVTRWLDDIGLPQYKTQFDEGRVDGRMLHYMTVDDLLSLKVGSVLHHLSIKRAIQVLRLNNYDPNCLRRRPSDENNISPAEISQWTNHRVMEWLRSADLAEYAPNLRGSGVHGGLMVLEPRFNVETMALLLNIPPNKTLLRRHLATHLNLLVGSEAQQLKQECLENPDYTLLTATAKVKPHKLAFGGFGRKKKQEDNEEYVCPMDVEMPKGRSFQKGYRGMELQSYDDDLDRFDQMEDSEGTVRQIGVFSEGINNLTSMLKEDEFFKGISTSFPNASVKDDDSNV